MRKTVFICLTVIISSFSFAQNKELINDWRAERRDSIRAVIRERMYDFGPNYNADSVRKEIESVNYFTLFKDNYFIGGTVLGHKMKASNSNIKFQISISQRLTKSILPFDTYLFIHFSQKTIWNVLEKSLPMYDINFNPGIGLGHLIIHKNRYIGRAILMLEHESNGKDDLADRSWNKVSFGINVMVNNNFDAQLKLWVPIIDSENNRDIVKYKGIGHFGLNYYSNSKRFHAGLLTSIHTKSFGFNTQWELSLKLDKRDNQYLFIQYFNGYGENLLDYNRHNSVLRLGFAIKPRDFTIY